MSTQQDPPAQDDAQVQDKDIEIARLKEMAARAQADLQNAKERLERDAAAMRSFAVAGLLTQLLPTLDNLQRAFDHLPEELVEHDWVKGVKAVEEHLMAELASAGLSKVTALGEVVDAEKHEVLQTGPGEQNRITEVFEEGYELNGKVLRPAKVKVGDGSNS